MQLKLENISARKNFSISFYIQKKFTLSKKGIPSKKNFFDHSNYSKLTRLLNVPVLNRRKKKIFFSFSRQRKERSFLFHQFKVFQPYYPVPLRTSRIPPHSCGPASHLFSVFFVFFSNYATLLIHWGRSQVWVLCACFYVLYMKLIIRSEKEDKRKVDGCRICAVVSVVNLVLFRNFC